MLSAARSSARSHAPAWERRCGRSSGQGFRTLERQIPPPSGQACSHAGAWGPEKKPGIQVLPASRKGQRNIGSPGSRQNVGDPRGRQNVGGPRGRQHIGGSGDARPAGTAVFQTAYRPHDQLAATLRADALWSAPDNAGPPAGVIPVYANARHWPDALRGAELLHSHAARGNEKKNRAQRVTMPWRDENRDC